MSPAVDLRIGGLKERFFRGKAKTRRSAVPALGRICRSSVRGLRPRDWKQEFECRAFVDFAFDFDPATMLLNDPGRNGQAKAGSFRFSGHKRDEKVCGQVRRNP